MKKLTTILLLTFALNITAYAAPGAPNATKETIINELTGDQEVEKIKQSITMQVQMIKTKANIEIPQSDVDKLFNDINSDFSKLRTFLRNECSMEDLKLIQSAENDAALQNVAQQLQNEQLMQGAFQHLQSGQTLTLSAEKVMLFSNVEKLFNLGESLVDRFKQMLAMIESQAASIPPEKQGEINKLRTTLSAPDVGKKTANYMYNSIPETDLRALSKFYENPRYIKYQEINSALNNTIMNFFMEIGYKTATANRS